MSLIESLKISLLALWANKLRSFLTMLGIIIGIAAVVSLISIGQGVKADIEKQVTDIGSNLLFVVPGKLDTSGRSSASPTQFIGGSVLTEKDMATIKTVESVQNVAPLSLLSGILIYQGKTSPRAILIGTTPTIKDLTNFTLSGGRFLEQSDEGKYVLALGKVPKEELFGQEDAVGKKVMIGRQEFEVIGVFEKPGTSNILGGEEFQSFVTVPFETGKIITGSTQIHRILIKVSDGQDIKKVADVVKQKLLENHSGQEDFSVLTQEDLLNLLSMILNLMTLLISAIAAISLIVGGIGIMNIMLVSVTERTREIGLRKAVGATSGAIMLQFLIEAVIISVLGGALGIAFSFLASLVIRLKTIIQPQIVPSAIFLALGVCIGVGIVFGLMQAIRAAKKDPIEALRYE